MRRGLLLVAIFAAAFAAGRYMPGGARGGTTGARPASADVEGASSIEPRTPPALSPSRGAARPNPRQTRWNEHVARDPEHHAADAQKIQHAFFFGTPETVTDLESCRPDFPPIETKVRLRTTIAIGRNGIEIGPAESVTVIDGVEISAKARTCLLAAFRRSAKALPTYPDDVHPYHGPYDLELSVVGGADEPIDTGDEQ